MSSRRSSAASSADPLDAFLRNNCVDRAAMVRALQSVPAVDRDTAGHYRGGGRARDEALLDVHHIMRHGDAESAATMRLVRTLRRNDVQRQKTARAVAAVGGKPQWSRSTSYQPREDPLRALLRAELEKRGAAAQRQP
jgi:hypothetical protein